MTYALHQGDCLEVLRTLPDASVDAIVTDPPYGLSFMGKRWDYDVPSVDVWAECLRVLKPGGHLLAFAGTRTQHRMAVRIEDAGFEIRDLIAWVYGQGFPKSADVSKHLDAHEKKRWLDVAKAVDKADHSAILAAWKEYSKTASSAGLSFVKSETETGTSTPKSGSVPEHVALQANQENNDAVAVLAELSSREARPMCEEMRSVLTNADSGEKPGLVRYAESRPQRLDATCIPTGTVLCVVKDWQSESTADKLKAVEALKTWLGSKPSSRREATGALCAALTDDLKLITLNQSKTFLSFDTTRQMACASVISATITESTAESLISFTADTLRSKAIDKAAGAEREVVGQRDTATGGDKATNTFMASPRMMDITAPATDAARQWQGWGTALKPALEPITVARKPLHGTVAENVLAHGTGALNVDGCRVGTESVRTMHTAKREGTGQGWHRVATGESTEHSGRWPANLIHDGSEEVVGLFPGGEDGGSAARFFYEAKASKADRDAGCEGMEKRSAADMVERSEGSDGMDNPRAGAGRTSGARNHHPTVKPTDLMRYLCRLVTPPGGVVLDPFTGSGSTGRGAILEGFRFIGIEREPEYVAIARARIEDAVGTRRAETAQGELPL
jgi:DNA modification methylase